ncbi:MAG TPA: hypothetical protein VE338_10840, partial [Ktedonobacterales bacterium]|nr:hypothetical protein [Ktedonobacterales bacterium]
RSGARGMRSAEPAGAGISLGSALAASQWAWASDPTRATPTTAQASAAPRAVRASSGACLRAPVDLLTQMSDVARALGRSESEVWVEAAREYLRRRDGESGAPPVTPAQSAGPVSRSRRATRMWDDIDALLTELRAPSASEREGAPAA